MVWKDIPGYEGLYLASNNGDIYSVKRGIILKQRNKGKYKRVNLCKDGVVNTHSVHRLVAMAHIPNPHNLPMINHKDENPANNCVDNLEWCDAYYNNNYGTMPQRVSETLSIPVIKVDNKTREIIECYASGIDAANKNNLTPQAISQSIHRRKHYGDYYFIRSDNYALHDSRN